MPFHSAPSCLNDSNYEHQGSKSELLHHTHCTAQWPSRPVLFVDAETICVKSPWTRRNSRLTWAGGRPHVPRWVYEVSGDQSTVQLLEKLSTDNLKWKETWLISRHNLWAVNSNPADIQLPHPPTHPPTPPLSWGMSYIPHHEKEA